MCVIHINTVKFNLSILFSETLFLKEEGSFLPACLCGIQFYIFQIQNSSSLNRSANLKLWRNRYVWVWIWQDRPQTVTSSNLLYHHSQNTSAHLSHKCGLLSMQTLRHSECQNVLNKWYSSEYVPVSAWPFTKLPFYCAAQEPSVILIWSADLAINTELHFNFNMHVLNLMFCVITSHFSPAEVIFI